MCFDALLKDEATIARAPSSPTISGTTLRVEIAQRISLARPNAETCWEKTNHRQGPSIF